MEITPKIFKHLLNFYPPYLGAGTKINYISEDWRELHVSMSVRWFNRNAVPTVACFDYAYWLEKSVAL